MKFIEAGQVKLAQTKYLWSIPNFSNLYKSTKFHYILSPPFLITVDGVESKFALLIKRHTIKKSKYINIYMIRSVTDKSEKNCKINASIEFAVLDAFNKVVYQFPVAKNYPHSNVLVDIALEEAMIFENKNCLLKKELRVIWNFVSNDVKNKIQDDQKVRKFRLREFDNFEKMLDNDKFSDVILCVKGRNIHAHKNIIANKSPVFDAMFTHDMFESRTNKVDITDFDYDVMYEVLRYMYIGKINDFKEKDAFVKYSNIFKAADKYLIDSLKIRCEKKLSQILTTENVLDCLIFADEYNTENLKRKIMNFIVGHAEEIVELPEYKDFVELYVDASIDIVRALVVKKRRTE